jgi:hypothetical protein
MPPHGKTYYYLVVVLTVLLGTLFGWGVVHWGAPSASRLFGLGLVAVLILGAMQALERLFRPNEANRRSAAFSPSARRKIRIVCNVIGTTGTAGGVIGLLFHVTDLQILPGVLYFICFLLADLMGESPFRPIGA